MREIRIAIECIRNGGLVCYPTESSYGLAVDPRDESALLRLTRLKGRNPRAPFALIAGNLEQAQACTGAWPSEARDLAAALWPGPLTLVLPACSSLAAACLGPKGGVGVRVSRERSARQLALGLGCAVTATSANPRGALAAASLRQAQRYFGDAVDCYLEGGHCEGKPSTVVEFDALGVACVLREGAITLPWREVP